VHGIRQMHNPRRVTTAGVGRDPVPAAMRDGRRPWSLMVLPSVAQFMVILDATAGGLAAVAALLVPAVRPAAGTRVAVH
jgi:hypothetical protein